MHDFLLNNNLKDSIHHLTSLQMALRVLLHKRVDFILCSWSELKNNAYDLFTDINQFEMSLVGYTLQEYMAFGKTTSPDVIQKLQKAYQELKEQGLIILH